jgi:NAD+ synthase (glutamine-hydrolysing)
VKIALAQISPHLGDIGKNLDLHLGTIEKASRKKAGLIVFPELSLTGYTLMDLVPDVALKPDRHLQFQKLVARSRSIDIVVGFVEERGKGLFYNSAAYLSAGRILHVHRKAFLPTGGMFEEAKFFAPGKSFRTFDTSFGKAGLMICRDFLNYGAGYTLFAGGADFVIIISAAPGRGMTAGDAFATSRMWELMGEAISYFSTVFVVYCNRVGFEDGKAFAGGSFIFGPDGRRLAKAPEAEEDLVVEDLQLEDIRAARKKWTFLRDDRPEVILHSLQRIVEDDED